MVVQGRGAQRTDANVARPFPCTDLCSYMDNEEDEPYNNAIEEEEEMGSKSSDEEEEVNVDVDDDDEDGS